ncbi:MAG: KH domain-containing protein [Nanoarchaeota archaeon]
MKKLIIDKLPRITQNKTKLEEELHIKISNRGREVYIYGEAEDEYLSERVIEALNFGFPFATALLLKHHENVLEIINIKNHTPKKDYARIRARLIGKGGKTLKTLSELTKCDFEIKDNFVGIIGEAEFIENAQEAIISLIRGSKQGNVYAFLEKRQPQPILDLGLKEVKKKKK